MCKSLWDKLLAVTERDAATPQSVAEGTSLRTFDSKEDRHGHENGPERSAGGPKGSPAEHYWPKPWQRRDQPGIKAQHSGRDGAQMNAGVL